MAAPGFSGSTHERLDVRLASGECRRLVLKRTRLGADWTAYRTGDAVGREAALLADAALAPIWEIFTCPYLAFATEDGEISVLLEDVTEHLFPDVREPISEAAEDALLGRLAALHARFWNADVLEVAYLARPPARYGILGPRLTEEVPQRGGEAPVLGRARTGWAAAMLDVGWYLSVNGSRLARPKEAIISFYRAALEHHGGIVLPDTWWDRMVSAALLFGAQTLLWSKALAVEAGAPGAQREWDWWVERLAIL